MRLFLLLLGLILAAAPSYAASLAGTACTTLGQTKMDSDESNLVACLRSGGSMTWKVMTTSSASCGSGQAVTNFTNGVPTCGSVSSGASSTTPANPYAGYYQCPNYVVGSSYKEYVCYGKHMSVVVTPTTCVGQISSQSSCFVTYTGNFGSYCNGAAARDSISCSLIK